MPPTPSGYSGGPSGGAKLKDLSETVLINDPGADLVAPASRSEELKTVRRLLQLSERLHDEAPAASTGVPLCQDCASGVLRLLTQKLEEAHEEREKMEAAMAELYAGEAAEPPDVSAAAGGGGGGGGGGEETDAPLSEAEFARERKAQQAEADALKAELAAAEQERAGLREEFARLTTERYPRRGWNPGLMTAHCLLPLIQRSSPRAGRDTQEKLLEERHAELNRLELQRMEEEEEALRVSQLVAKCEAPPRAGLLLASCWPPAGLLLASCSPPARRLLASSPPAQRLLASLVRCEAEIQRLEAEDVLTGVFHIDAGLATPGSAGPPVGAINSLRLGRAAGVTVEWTELNAALGQVVLLVHTLGRLHLPGGEFVGHVLYPHGSLCRAASRKEPAKLYELFGSGQISARFFGGSARGVERGQGLLLACVDELCAHATRHPPPPSQQQPQQQPSGLPGGLPGGPARSSFSAPAPQPPFAVSEIGSVVGGASPAAEGKKLLATLQWLLDWSRATRNGSTTIPTWS